MYTGSEGEVASVVGEDGGVQTIVFLFGNENNPRSSSLELLMSSIIAPKWIIWLVDEELKCF